MNLRKLLRFHDQVSMNLTETQAVRSATATQQHGNKKSGNQLSGLQQTLQDTFCRKQESHFQVVTSVHSQPSRDSLMDQTEWQILNSNHISPNVAIWQRARKHKLITGKNQKQKSVSVHQ